MVKQAQNTSLDKQEFNHCLLFGVDDFEPTQAMSRLVMAWIEDEGGLSLLELMDKKLGIAKQNWYNWQIRKPGFKKWFAECLNRLSRADRNINVKNVLYYRAMQGDTTAIKTWLELNEPAYKPTTAQERTHSFAGYKPGQTTAELAEKSRQRKAVHSQQQGSGHELLSHSKPIDNDNTEDIH